MGLYPLIFWWFEWMKKILNVVKIVIFMREPKKIFANFLKSLFIPLLVMLDIVIDISKNIEFLWGLNRYVYMLIR